MAGDLPDPGRGPAGPDDALRVPGLHAEADGEDTVLTGTLADQAALYGVLARVEALGLELLEVRRESPGDVTPAHPGADDAKPS